jgi:hypothetical protein
MGGKGGSPRHAAAICLYIIVSVRDVNQRSDPVIVSQQLGAKGRDCFVARARNDELSGFRRLLDVIATTRQHGK